jgi:hypothetical protein
LLGDGGRRVAVDGEVVPLDEVTDGSSNNSAASGGVGLAGASSHPQLQRLDVLPGQRPQTRWLVIMMMSMPR